MSTTSDTCDVVIVGAGLVGALVAREFADKNQTVAILEAREHPGGSAPQSVGLALLGTPEPYITLTERIGTEIAQQVWQLTLENLDLLKKTLERFQLPTAQVGSLRLTSESSEATIYQNSIDLLNQTAYTAILEDATDYGYLIGIKTQADVSFSPSSLVEALLDHPNITVETQAEAQEIRKLNTATTNDTSQFAIWAHKHYIRAQQVVIAGGIHATRLSRSLSSVIHPQLIQSIDVHTTESLDIPLLLNNGQIVIYPDAEHWQLAGWQANNDTVWPLLVETAEQFCPQATVQTRNSVWVAQSNDGFPIVGQIPEIPGVYTITGLGPWGLSWTHITVKHLIALMLDHKETRFFNINRFFRED